MNRIKFRASISEIVGSEKYTATFPVGSDGSQSKSVAIIWKNSIVSQIDEENSLQFIECDENDSFTIVRGNGMASTQTFKQFYESKAKGYTGQSTQITDTGIVRVP